jgi:threonine aldolase
MNFRSDNEVGAHPSVIAAVGKAFTSGAAFSYGADDWTHRVEGRLRDLFEKPDLVAFPVVTGTAANSLALACCSPPWGAIFCHPSAHIAAEETGAPEFYTAGARLFRIDGAEGKVDPVKLAQALAQPVYGVPHFAQPAAVSVTQATECGTVYGPEEIAAIATSTHRHDLKLHMDGARFANALVRMNATPAEATWKAGVDALSFGATKGGALAAEAVIFFDPSRAAAMQSRRKRSGHLVSKHRFLAAQIDAYLEDDLWLTLARHANTMADRLAEGLARAGLPPVWPVEANEVFVMLPPKIDQRLKASGALYHPWSTEGRSGANAGRHETLVRLVTSFATTSEEVDRFLALVEAGR